MCRKLMCKRQPNLTLKLLRNFFFISSSTFHGTRSRQVLIFHIYTLWSGCTASLSSFSAFSHKSVFAIARQRLSLITESCALIKLSDKQFYAHFLCVRTRRELIVGKSRQLCAYTFINQRGN